MPTTPPSITPAPTAPQRNVKATFSDRVDAFVTWLVAAVAQFAALATNVFNNATEAFNSATTAANWAGIATGKAAEAATSASNASESVIAAAANNGATMWASGTTYQQYQVAVSKINFRTYRKTTTAAASTGGVTDPANDSANWQVTGVTTVRRMARTANTMLAPSDVGSIIDITSGTFAQTFAACATLGNGWHVWLKNSGTGDVTLDPAGTETIDGLTSFIMYPGEGRLVQCDGTVLRSIVVTSFNKTFATTANFIKPPGYSYFAGLLWGAGGSGARWSDISFNYSAHGGAGGACSEFKIPASKFADSEIVTIGAGGASISTNGNGVAGGESSIGSILRAGGGSGGIQSIDGSTNTGGGSAYGQGLLGLVNYLNGGNSSNAASVYGGGAGATYRQSSQTQPGTSVFGGDGGAQSDSSAAGAGIAPAGGGGGTRAGTSGAGARGELRIWGIA